MLNVKDLLLVQERQQDLQRQARKEHLAREARLTRQTWRTDETERTPKDTSSQMMRTLSRLAALFL